MNLVGMIAVKQVVKLHPQRLIFTKTKRTKKKNENSKDETRIKFIMLSRNFSKTF